MKYSFCEGIAIAYGATGSCIYDLREPFAKIYRIGKKKRNLFVPLQPKIIWLYQTTIGIFYLILLIRIRKKSYVKELIPLIQLSNPWLCQWLKRV